MVPPKAAAAEPSAAAGGFLAEIDVIVRCRLDRVGDELHLVYRNTERSLTVLRIDPARTSAIPT